MVTYGSDEGYRPLKAGIGMKNLVQGESTMMLQFRLDEGSHLQRHKHPQEQTGYMIAGSLRLRVGDETFTVGPGDSWNIPGDTPHSADALADTVLIEVFSPLREDYLPNAE